jgi:hypothetical protein
MHIKEKLKSQIGDDIQHIFDHEALFKDALRYIEEIEINLNKAVNVLESYEEQGCEGFCEDLVSHSTYNPDMDFDCSGCRARALVAEIKEWHIEKNNIMVGN